MGKSKNLKDEEARIVVKKVLRFNELVKNHRKLIEAIGHL